MEANEIKKSLYKENPKANLEFIRKGCAFYSTFVNGETVLFEIPVKDMGDADLLITMDAKHLIKWLIL